MSIAELRQLPTAEKLKIIEALWSDLAANENRSPAPHGMRRNCARLKRTSRQDVLKRWTGKMGRTNCASSLNEGQGSAPGTERSRVGRRFYDRQEKGIGS